MPEYLMSRKLAAEALGSFFLFAGVVGSGIMGEALAGGNDAIALIANAAATGAILYVLIEMLGPISGAHFNPAVTFAMVLRKRFAAKHIAPYVLAQLTGGILGVWAAHLMFDLPILQLSEKVRTGSGQWVSELIATFGLVFTIFAVSKHRTQAVGPAVGLYIGAAYWFTASTSFANPAISVARSLSNTFAGIAPADVPVFVIFQLLGAALAAVLAGWLLLDRPTGQA